MSADGMFDVCGSLPEGVTVLEASAGTGKTFTIAALAARYVAAGTPLERLLLVTFTRNATGELRERVRERLVTAERGLARALAGVAPPDDDEVLGLLTQGSDAEVVVRRRRPAAALADFDAATIATTHGFCQQILASLGVAGDVEADVTFVDDVSDLVEEVVDDLYVYRTLRVGLPPFGRDEAMAVARVAVENPLAPLEPAAADPNSVPGRRLRLANAVRAEVDRRKRAAKIITYDDLLTRLVATLDDPERGPAACARLRERYEVALVDEFQDTDPIQWDIMRLAFADTGATLVLIGDPKQAIYAFRGADVFAYLEAAASAGSKATLGVNWRSDQGLVDAYDALFAGTRLGHEGIVYRTVQAADANQAPRVQGAPHPAALRVRVVHRDDGLVGLSRQGYVSKKPGLAHVTADLADDLVGLLSSGACVLGRHRNGSEASRERIRPRHVAVLVRTHRNAALVRDALDAVGIPAVINGAGSVFATVIAREWLTLLEALERPASPARARAAALSSFLGWTAEQVAAADDDQWEAVHARLHRWADVLRRRGLASLLETVTLSEGLPGRLLGREAGERELTDLRHVGQLLHAEAVSERLGVTALAAWLRQRIAQADADTRSEERSRRLESDAEAVQVLTIHRSKGLEFPIVYYPDLWEPGWIPDDAPPVFHDDAGRRTINVGMGGPGFGQHRRRHIQERRGEDLRLAYVALTRARHRAVVWWASSWDSRDSSLGRLLFARDADGNVAAEGDAPPKDSEVLERLGALASQAPGAISVERTGEPDGASWTVAPTRTAALRAQPFERGLDRHWRRTSYSAITASAHEPRVGSEPEAGGLSDEMLAVPIEAAGTDVPDSEEAALRDRRLPLADMPGGTAVGSLLHGVLEAVDFSSSTLDTDLRAALDAQLAWRHLDPGDPDAIVEGLAAAIATPLGPSFDEVSLSQFAPSDRLAEVEFELPLAGGDLPSGEVTVDAIAALLRAHLPAGDPLAGYHERLSDPALSQRIRGFLTGSIDLVLRRRRPDGTPRFAVVDHKSNWLGADGQRLTAWHYRPAALAEAMQRAHYPLQALLYTVALHRYLRWRLPAYDPACHLAGTFYLFLRGMTGPGGPRVDGQPCGVFVWQPPHGLVEALSDLFDRGEGP